MTNRGHRYSMTTRNPNITDDALVAHVTAFYSLAELLSAMDRNGYVPTLRCSPDADELARRLRAMGRPVHS